MIECGVVKYCLRMSVPVSSGAMADVGPVRGFFYVVDRPGRSGRPSPSMIESS